MRGSKIVALPINQSGREARRLARNPKGRVCAHPGCDTILTTYNPSPHCFRHDKSWSTRVVQKQGPDRRVTW